MNTIENNKLIALFMGGNFKDNNEAWLPIHGICYYHTIELGNGKILEYHKSWDWLMPVVEKIESIEQPFKINVTIENSFCEIGYFKPHVSTKNPNVIHNESNGNKLNSVYICVVEFIKYYNLNKK